MAEELRPKYVAVLRQMENATRKGFSLASDISRVYKMLQSRAEAGTCRYAAVAECPRLAADRMRGSLSADV